MKIMVRQEIVKCNKCKKGNRFYYLSDFSYGERLALYENGEKYAYINLLKDNAYDDFVERLKEALEIHEKKYSDRELLQLVNRIFGIACDEIDGSAVDFDLGNKTCAYCGSDEFEDLLVEPETQISIEVPNVTTEKWLNTPEKNKIELSERKLFDLGY